MRVFHELSRFKEKTSNTSVAIGNFDGVHLGHQQLIQSMIALSKTYQTTPVVLTFYPHPVEVLRPGTHLERLTTTNEKLSLLESLGVESVLVASFSDELAKIDPIRFLEDYLMDGMGAKTVHVGQDFMFGRGRAGNIEVLRNFCQEKEIHCEVFGTVEHQGKKVSSSLIRELLLGGNVVEARGFLTRPHFVWGPVVRGDGRGRQIGFPTANLLVPRAKLLPKEGVYCTEVHWQHQRYGSVTNIGRRPTFGPEGSVVVETHILDFSENLYDESLTVSFLDRIREEQKFASIEELKGQIQRDIETARKLLKLT